MRLLGTTLLLCLVTAGIGSPARGALPVPVHPDTLPTLERSWTLPASLAPVVTNTYAPRMTLSGMLLYVFDHHGRRLVAVEATSGKVAWHAPVPSDSDRAFAVTPLVANDSVYVANDGHVFAFDSATGKVRWDLRTKGVAMNGLARSKHHLFVPWVQVTGVQAQPGVQLWAIDSRTGRVEWTKKLPGGLAYVTGDADGAYYVSDTGTVLALTADRGDPKWQLRVQGQVLSEPIMAKGRLFISTHRQKAGWAGTGLAAIDLAKGKLLWETKLGSTLVSKFAQEADLITVEANGQLPRHDAEGKHQVELQLGFGDEPDCLKGAATGERGVVFAHQADGNGYLRLLDLKAKKALAVANAINLPVRSIIPAAKMLFIDGVDGQIYAFRLDRSRPPVRATVPADEFAKQMLDRISGAKAPVRGLAAKLAGLGPKALPAIEPALQSPNPFVVDLAAQAIGLLASKASVPALIKAIAKQKAAPQPVGAKLDPLVALIDALAELRDPKAIPELQQLMKDESQSHQRRRAAYVALGAIGSPASLAPIWAFRATKQVTTIKWEPMAFTPSYDYQVEAAVATTAARWPDNVRRETALTVQNKAEQIFTAALSPYLGGYNDVWLGRSDLSGVITAPLFTGVTKPEMVPGRRIRLKQLAVSEKGEVNLVVETKEGDRWAAARPMRFTLQALGEDSDGDRLPDLVEKRLRLCTSNPDCDGDGLKDSEDLNPLASGKLEPSGEQRLFREAFFTFYAFLKRRGIVVVDPGDGPSFELYGRQDPVLSLRRTTIEKLRREAGLHAIDYVSFGGPYPEGAGSGDALPKVVWNAKKTEATVGMDIFRSGENAAAFNVTLKKSGKSWVVSRFFRVWTTN